MNKQAVKIQLMKSAVKSSETVEKILTSSTLKPSEIKRKHERIEILNPGKTPTMEEKNWIAFQQIGEKTLNCILNVWKQ